MKPHIQKRRILMGIAPAETAPAAPRKPARKPAAKKPAKAKK